MEEDVKAAVLTLAGLDWFPLTYKGRQAGSIYLELTFYAAVSGVLFPVCMCGLQHTHSCVAPPTQASAYTIPPAARHTRCWGAAYIDELFGRCQPNTPTNECSPELCRTTSATTVTNGICIHASANR